jgi:signal transduction histidine kinase
MKGEKMAGNHNSEFALYRLRIFKLYQESIIYHFLGWVRIRGKYPLDDRVKDLQGRPLGMFFYNQRAIFFLLSLLFLAALLLLVFTLDSTVEMRRSVLFLAVFWVAGALLTISLHPIFKRKLAAWAASMTPLEYPPMFDLYFILDWLLVFFLVALGRFYNLPFDAFTFLLFANTIVYSSYIRDSRNVARIALVVVSLAFIVFLLYPGVGWAQSEPRGFLPYSQHRWFYATLYLGPILSTLVASVSLVIGISLLRALEQSVTQLRLELLGEYESILSHPLDSPHVSDSPSLVKFPTGVRFQDQVQLVLEGLCSNRPPFWYDAACLWLIEQHQDRGDVFLPGPSVRFDKAQRYESGIERTAWLLEQPEKLTMITSLKYYFGEEQLTHPQFRNNLDAPAAFIPITRGERCVGVLALYGQEGGPPLQRQEEAFLKSLGAIISNTAEQWDGRYKAFPQMEMDNLFKLNDLDEVFKETAGIMKRYLVAGGCMVIFRRDPGNEDMELKAWVGFDDSILSSEYRVGEGLTGKCAEIGETIRCDDVKSNERLFAPKLLANLRKAHGKEIHSWMAIPIGHENKNYGVIKVVNRTSRCAWFTKEDQRLGESLALRLRIIIEKFLHIEMLAAATEEAKRQSTEAKLKSDEVMQEKKRAEEEASNRQEDLMVITHQLQAPLSSVIGALTSLRRKALPKFIENNLHYVQALVEDGLTLCYGTTTSLVLAAGRKTHFDVADIDAPLELKKLCDRLQLTNAREDLNFSYHKDEKFPTLRMDRDIFTSVMYSLIHNAMKYSDEYSQVSLMCKLLDGKPVLEVSSKGEPIHSKESKEIFKKFKRGMVVEETGRHHRGVGIGLWAARRLMREIDGDLSVILPPSHPRLSIFVVHLPCGATSTKDPPVSTK